MSLAAEQPGLDADRRFFAVMAVVVLAVVFVGFANTYYLWPLTRATHTASGALIPSPRSILAHVHAVVFSGWILLFLTQVSLVAAGRARLHRRLGLAAAWMIPVMVLTGLFTAVHGARNGWNPGGPFPDSLSFMVAGFRDLTIFLILTAAGLAWRRRPDVHKRLMLLGTMGGLLWPAITRIPGLAPRFVPMFAVLAVLVLAPAARDLLARRPTRWLSLGVGIGILATFPAAMAIGNSTWWRGFAAWITQ
jgi:uncharacterized membrane protein YozB (DUF420 family)